jgi:CheY-like chemotaxis protein
MRCMRFIGWATNAADAERLAANHAPDVILMDVRLKGGVDGTEAAARLRKWHHVPIIFATGAMDDAMHERIGSVPSSSVLQRPYSLTQPQAALDWARGQAGT